MVGSNSAQGTTTVLFVDFGNTENVKNSAIKVLPDHLKSSPPVAIKCRVTEGPLVTMSAEQILTLLQGKELTVLLSGDAEPYYLSITGEDLSDGKA